MSQILLAILRRLFSSLPLSEEQRTAAVFLLFRLTGDRFRALPSYQQWLRHGKWRRAVVPAEPRAARTPVLAQATRDVAGGRAMLVVSHDLGGGTQTHVDDMTRRLESEGWRVLLLQRHNEHHVRVALQGTAATGLLPYRWPDEVPALIADLQALGTVHMHVHHTVDLPEGFLAVLVGMADTLACPFDLTVHDYFAICPRFTLFDEAVQGVCGEPQDVRQCTACVARQGSPVGRDIDVATWRRDFGAVLQRARTVYVPDADVGRRLQRYFPARTFSVMPHPEEHGFLNCAARRMPGRPLKLVSIGGIGPHKGSRVLHDCAADAVRRGLPLEFHLVGYSDIDDQLRKLRNVSISGSYSRRQLTERLAAGGFHMAFLPAVWPETYSYALSECWRHGLYTVGLDIGAIASRLRAAPGLGAVLPYEWYLTPGRINDALLEITPPGLRADAVHAALAAYANVTREYYHLPAGP